MSAAARDPSEVVTTRVLPATPEQLFDAFADPAQLAQWWGPEGFTNEFDQFDLRPGGRWRFVMRGPDGAHYLQDKVFVEVERPRRVVLQHAQDQHSFQMAMTFEAEAAGTRVTWRMRFASPEELAPVEARVIEANEENLDRLAAHLRGNQEDTFMQPTPDEKDLGFTIERTFKAAPEKVWRMWTTPEGIRAWWVESARDMGFEMTVRGLDLREGGAFAFEMSNKAHHLVNRGTYTTVQPYTRLAWTWHFDIYLAPGQEPYDVPIHVSFERTGTGGTLMRFTQGPLAAPGHTEGSRKGVLANFEKLAAALGE